MQCQRCSAPPVSPPGLASSASGRSFHWMFPLIILNLDVHKTTQLAKLQLVPWPQLAQRCDQAQKGMIYCNLFSRGKYIQFVVSMETKSKPGRRKGWRLGGSWQVHGFYGEACERAHGTAMSCGKRFSFSVMSWTLLLGRALVLKQASSPGHVGAACGSVGRVGWLVTRCLLVWSPASPSVECSWSVHEHDASPCSQRAGCRVAWLTLPSVCECVDEFVNVRQYCIALWEATG